MKHIGWIVLRLHWKEWFNINSIRIILPSLLQVVKSSEHISLTRQTAVRLGGVWSLIFPADLTRHPQAAFACVLFLWTTVNLNVLLFKLDLGEYRGGSTFLGSLFQMFVATRPRVTYAHKLNFARLGKQGFASILFIDINSDLNIL